MELNLILSVVQVAIACGDADLSVVAYRNYRKEKDKETSGTERKTAACYKLQRDHRRRSAEAGLLNWTAHPGRYGKRWMWKTTGSS